MIIRQQHAYSILKCADYAQELGIKTVSLVEFGVAHGAGIMNMAEIAKNITKETGISFKIYGFDTGKGMPMALDYRDHPDLYQAGDFPMNYDILSRNLPDNASLIIGNISDNVEQFIKNIPQTEPVGFVSVDVDYYYSTKDVLKVFMDNNPKKIFTY